MSRSRKSIAPHVRAAIEKGGSAPVAAQPKATATGPGIASHVQAAIQAGMGGASGPAQPKLAQSRSAQSQSAQPKSTPSASSGIAPHVQAMIYRGRPDAAQLQPAESQSSGEGSSDAQMSPPARAAALHGVSEYVQYVDVKSAGTPPPPPLRPVYSLSVSDGACSVRDIKTGRQRPADDFFGGFVRMGKGGQIYVSPRAGVGAPGDSHPSIASATPEWQSGTQSVVAAGEIGVLGGEIVGHNDKTGHFLSRKNLRQSGLPSEKFHPFTDEVKDWYKK